MEGTASSGGPTRVGVVGLGYVGLPLVLAMHRSGYEVVGVDVDETVVRQLRAGESTVTDVDSAAVAAAVDAGVEFTTEYDALDDVDGVSICVPTPLRKTDTPDLSYVIDAAERIAPVVPNGCTVILESTVYPGATEEVVGTALAEGREPTEDPTPEAAEQLLTEDGGVVRARASGNVIGEDIYLAFSPERIDPGNEEYGPTDIPKVLGGVTPACGDHAAALYEPVFDEVVRVDSAMEAELVKLLENTFRAVNVGLINELAQVAHELDVDIWNAIDAAETKPFGFMPFYPGPGLGGHCIPIDPFYLSWKASEHGIETRFINLADTVNREMPDHVVDRVVRLLNDRGTALSQADVLLVGVAYKPDVSDTRESPAVDIASELEAWNANVAYHDPHVPTLAVDETIYESVPLSDRRLAAADCVVIVTDHAAVDTREIVDGASLVFDARNATAGMDAPNVVRL
jgi:UDP-N-acetyl-D-glucosamine dehydrogenase